MFDETDTQRRARASKRYEELQRRGFIDQDPVTVPTPSGPRVRLRREASEPGI